MTATFFDCNSIPEERKNKILSDIVLLILRFNDDKKPIWYGKIKDTLVPVAMTRNEFECMFTFLEDMMWIYRDAGSLGDGRAGFRWYIDEAYVPFIREEIKKKGIEWR
jgi:hypothetical protein